MRERLFAISGFFVGLVLLALMMVGMQRAAIAESQPPPPRPLSLSVPFLAPDRAWVTGTHQITSVVVIEDVGKFTSGALDQHPFFNADLELAGEDGWLVHSSGVATGTSSPCAYPLPDGLCVYYGDLHSHTGYSDGRGTPEQAYEMARANGLDFFATTDHAELLNASEWNGTLAQAQAATVEGRFVALRGFEWTSSHGHVNVFATDDLARASDPLYNSLDEFYDWLADPVRINSVAQFNHPFYPSNPFDGWRYVPWADLHIDLIETHNGSVDCTDKYDVALTSGWHVAAVSNSDTHQDNWGERRGRTGIIAPGLARHHVINALRARRTFSTEDENLALAMRADGYWMGSVIHKSPIFFEIYAFDPEPSDLLTALEIYRNGALFQSTAVNTNTFTWRFSLSAPSPPGTWWYAKAIQSDGEAAYSAPIWVDQPEPYDILIRDHLWDTGDVPSTNPSWESPDIWVRRQADDQIWHENSVAGETNHVYARVENTGSSPLTDVYVYFYWANPSLGFIWPDGWQPINATPVHVRHLSSGRRAIVGVPWDVPDSAPEHVCLFVRLVSAQDPILYEGYPRWDNNIGWKNIHIVDIGDGTAILPTKVITFHLANPFTEDRKADIRVSSSDFPSQGAITLRLDTELFDRWIVTDTSGLVKGAVIDPISRTIAITSSAEAVVYGLPLGAGESSTATLWLSVPMTSTLNIRVIELIDGEEIGGNLYTTSPSRVPRKIELEATADGTAIQGSVDITAVVVGEGFMPAADGTEVRFSTTLGSLSRDTVQTQNGLVTVTLIADVIPGTAIVQASVTGLVTATAAVDIYPTCWVRLNDDPTEYVTIQAAVDASTYPTDVVKVAGYCPNVNARGGLTQAVYISKTVTIRGGYTVTNWTTPDPATTPTVVDAQGQGRVLFVGGNISSTIEGLCITGGDAGGLGGGPAGGDAGGGLYIISATSAIRNNWILSNTAAYGGGLYLSSGEATLVNNVVVDNQADDLGGGLYVGGCSTRMLHTTIAHNRRSGICVTRSGLERSTLTLTNTILVSHMVGITVTEGNTVALEATLWGGDTWANGTDWGGAGSIVTGTRNFWGAPGFVAPNAGDYHISASSRARDAAVDVGVRDDVDGEPRPMGHGYDIGADELRITLMIDKFITPCLVEAGAPITYTIHVTNTGNVDLHATVIDTLPTHIAFGKTTGGTVVTPGGTITWTPIIAAYGGLWTQQVVVTVTAGQAESLTNVVKVTTDEGATGVYTHTLPLTASLEVAKQANPDPVWAGNPLVYTIYVTNTGNMNLHVTVTDTLPGHIASDGTAGGTVLKPGGTITWTPIITAPGGVWTQQVVVTVERGYAGLLTNVVQVAADGGAWQVYTKTSTVKCRVYLPVVMRSFSPSIPCAPRLIAEIEIGPEPYGVALDPAGKRAFVAHAEGVTVIDTVKLAVVTTTHSLTLSHGIAYDPDRNRIWVTRRNPDRVVVLDSVTYSVLADLPAGDGPLGVGYNPANGRVYVTNYWSGTVDVYDAKTMIPVAELTGFGEPAHLAINPVTNKVYVANHQTNLGVIVIDGATHSSDRVNTTLLDAYGVAVDTSRNLVYATGIAQGRISIIDGEFGRQIGELDIRHDDGSSVWLRVIAVNPNLGSEGHLLLITSSHDEERDQLLLIPNGWPTLGTPVPLDIASYPQDGIALEPERDRVWVTSVGSGLVSVVQDGEPVCQPTVLALP